MQCLYCEIDLKALRGLFDEDFCSKEHREKYFASFRKGINRLPVLDLPPLAPVRVVEALEEQQETELALARPVEIPHEPAEVPEPVVALIAEATVEPLLMSQTTIEEPEPSESIPEPVLAIAEEAPTVESVVETPLPVQEMAAKAPDLPAIQEAPVLVGATVEAAFHDDESSEAAVAPPAADFLHLQVSPFGAADCYFMVDENSFSACNGPAIPSVEVFCDAAFDPEELTAHLLTPAEMVAAGSVSGETRRGLTAEPLPAIATQLLSPSFRAWGYTATSTPALEVAELNENVEMFVAGAPSREMARFADSQPLTLPATPVTVPAFQASSVTGLHPHVAEPASLDFFCQQIESTPLMFSDVAAALEIHPPVFRAAVGMQLDEDLKRAIEPPKTEAVRLAEPEIARPAVMSASPVSRGVSAAAFQPPVPPASARVEAQLQVPAMSSQTDAVPGVASEAVSDPPRGAAAEQPPSAHSSEPVQPAIQSSVRIKNWRLKITFAKPA